MEHTWPKVVMRPHIWTPAILAEVCYVRAPREPGNLVDPYAVAIPFLLTVTLIWQLGFVTGLKYLNKAKLLHLVALKYGGF